MSNGSGSTSGFVTSSDGARIAYRTVGATAPGKPDLVFVNGLSADDFYWRPLLPSLGERGRLTQWDLPGHGRSEPARRPERLSIEACVDDLRLVLDAIEAESAVVIAFSMGCQIALEAWRHIPERIGAMALILGSYERPFDNLLHPRIGPVLGRSVSLLGRRSARWMMRGAHLATGLPGTIAVNRLLGIVGGRATGATMQPYFDHLGRLDGASWAGLALAAQRHSAEELLATISVPVLVIAGGRDIFTPQAASDHMAATIPGARYLSIAEATHTGLVEHSEAIAREIRDFLSENDIAQ